MEPFFHCLIQSPPTNIIIWILYKVALYCEQNIWPAVPYIVWIIMVIKYSLQCANFSRKDIVSLRNLLWDGAFSNLHLWNQQASPWWHKVIAHMAYTHTRPHFLQSFVTCCYKCPMQDEGRTVAWWENGKWVIIRLTGHHSPLIRSGSWVCVSQRKKQWVLHTGVFVCGYSEH